MKSNPIPLVLTLVFIANVFSVRADEKFSSLQTALSSTTLSGYVSAEITFQPQEPISRNDGLSLFPLLWVNSSEAGITAPLLNLIDVGIQNRSLNLKTFQPIVGNTNSTTGTAYGGDSSDAVIMEAIRQRAGAPSSPSILPPSGLQIQFSQGEIQLAPEPSTVALGSLAIGLIALTRLHRHRRI